MKKIRCFIATLVGSFAIGLIGCGGNKLPTTNYEKVKFAFNGVEKSFKNKKQISSNRSLKNDNNKSENIKSIKLKRIKNIKTFNHFCDKKGIELILNDNNNSIKTEKTFLDKPKDKVNIKKLCRINNKKSLILRNKIEINLFHKKIINENLDYSSSHNAIITELLNKTKKLLNKVGSFDNRNKNKNEFNNKVRRENKIKANKNNSLESIKEDILNNYNRKVDGMTKGNKKKKKRIKINDSIISNNPNKKYFNYNINKKADKNNSIYKTIFIKSNSSINLWNNNYILKERYKNILPNLSLSTSSNPKNEIKIAELKKINKLYPSNKNFNINIVNNNYQSCGWKKGLFNIINIISLGNRFNKYNNKDTFNNIQSIFQNRNNNIVKSNKYKFKSISSEKNKNVQNAQRPTN